MLRSTMKAPILCFAIALVLAIATYAQSTPAPTPTVITPTINPIQIIENPDATLNLVTRWTEIIGAIAALLSGLVIKIISDINNVKTQQKQQADNHAALSASVTSLALQTPPPTSPANSQAGPTVLSLIAILGLILLPGCASDGSLNSNGQKVVTSAVAVLNLAIDTYAQVQGAKASGQKLNTSQIATLAKSDVAGVAQLAQAYVGQTPAQAGIADGAANPAVGSAIQNALPNAPITQGTVNMLFAAAK